MNSTQLNSIPDFIEGIEGEIDSRIFYEGNGEIVSYGDLFSRAKALALYLIRNGLGPNSKVALFSNSNIDTIILILACWRLGAIAAPLNIKLKEDELNSILERLNPDFFLANDDSWSPEMNMGVQTQFLVAQYNEIGEHQPYRIDSKDLALLLFTSGSSGVPKAVPIRHSSIYLNVTRTSKALQFTEEDKLFINTPSYTTSSIIHCFTCLVSKAKIHIGKPTLFGEALLDALNQSEATYFGGVPVHFIRLDAALNTSNRLTFLRAIINSGDHLPEAVIRSLLHKIPSLRMYCIYGLTEVAGRLCILPPERTLAKIGSVGKPLEGMSIKILDTAQNEVHSNEQGEVYVNGDMLMEGYLNQPEINSRELTASGFKTGDIGFKDENGFLFLLGRTDDVIKVGGEKVSIKLIESVFASYPNFTECMIAVDSLKSFGKITVLYYVLKSGVDFSKGDLIGFAKDRLPLSQLPSKFIELKSIPRTASGKPIRKVVQV